MLSAIMSVPEQIPLESALTQAPLRLYSPEAQTIQSLEVPAVHVSQEEAHGVHVDPLLKLPSGQTVPLEVADCGGLHFVRSLVFWENPDLQVVQTPVPSSQAVHPNWHAALY